MRENVGREPLDSEGLWAEKGSAKRNAEQLSLNNPSKQSNVDVFVGKSPAFYSILDMIGAIAARKCSVIITGETGVGKEMVAHQIHKASDRAGKVFVPVDCTTLTGQLFESQLFGHVKRRIYRRR